MSLICYKGGVRKKKKRERGDYACTGNRGSIYPTVCFFRSDPDRHNIKRRGQEQGRREVFESRR
jgi:hypothetical protein